MFWQRHDGSVCVTVLGDEISLQCCNGCISYTQLLQQRPCVLQQIRSSSSISCVLLVLVETKRESHFSSLTISSMRECAISLLFLYQSVAAFALCDCLCVRNTVERVNHCQNSVLPYLSFVCDVNIQIFVAATHVTEVQCLVLLGGSQVPLTQLCNIQYSQLSNSTYTHVYQRLPQTVAGANSRGSRTSCTRELDSSVYVRMSIYMRDCFSWELFI